MAKLSAIGGHERIGASTGLERISVFTSLERINDSTGPKKISASTGLARISAVAACKGSRAVLHRAGSGGTAFPGRAAMLLKKDLLADVSEGMDCIVVTGTNGKTTTSAMLTRMLQLAGLDPVSNRSGANLLSGVTAELAACANWQGHPKKRYAVIECDEGALHQVVPLLRPKVIVVTNVFRDQLDRYGEVMHTLEAIRRGIRLAPDALLCLNADDSLTASLAMDLPNPVAWFGLEPDAEEEIPVTERTDTREEAFAGKEQTSEEGSSAAMRSPGAEKSPSLAEPHAPEIMQISDARFCIRCGTEYYYTFHTYAHLGGFYCPSCGYRRRKPGTAVMLPAFVSGSSQSDCTGEDASCKKTLDGKPPHNNRSPHNSKLSENKLSENKLSESKHSENMHSQNSPSLIRMCFSGGGPEPAEVKIAAPALYNLYNAAAAASAALESSFGIPCSAVIRALEETSGSFGRMERFVVGHVPVQMILVKNPAGCNQVLDYLCGIRKPYTAVLCLNDEDADGHDISWIWDVDYEKLAGDSFLQKICVWGKRAEDLQLRLKYAGMEESGIELVREKKTLLERIRNSPVPVYILPNYTTMLSLWKTLKKQALPS